MKSLAELYAPLADLTDKGTAHSYIEVYEELLAPYRGLSHFCLLEIGIDRGGSLLLWKDYFHENAYVLGVDINLDNIDHDRLYTGWLSLFSRVGVKLGDATKAETFAASPSPYHAAWDIVIDDGSHDPRDQWKTFTILWPRVRAGGLYVIEDIRHDATAHKFNRAGAQIVDLRRIKGRKDDRLAIWRKP